jgi:glycosyltransferase involved in cell wall biosynthesis
MRTIRVLEMIDRPFLGGGQMILLSIARGLDRSKFAVAACSRGGGPLVDELKRASIPHFAVPIGKTSGLGTVGAAAEVLRGQAIDVLHTHGGVAGLYGRLAARRAGTPVVVHTVHGIHYLHYRNPVFRRALIGLERRLGRRTDAVVFVSEADLVRARALRLAPADRLRLIRNGVDTLTAAEAWRVEALRKELGIEPGEVVIGAISRLHRQKGVAFLIDAARPVLERFPNARFLVAGGGPLETALASAVRERGLGRAFRLLGERSDAKELLALFDVFALPSLWEGLPLVLIEAAGLARPIVASDIDGVREVLRGGETGLLVPPGDPAALAAAILRLLEDKAMGRRLGEKARAGIPPAFSRSRMIAETQALYKELFEKRTASL